MAQVNKNVAKTKKSSFTYISPSIASLLIIVGLLYLSPLVDIGLIIAMIWLFRFSKGHKALRITWWLLLLFFIGVEILATIYDAHRLGIRLY
jgi:hypothetical protein